MKKWLIGLLLLLILFLVCAYSVIPGKITFSKVLIIKAKINVANRFLMDQNKWGKWFPAGSVNNSPTPGKKGYTYKNYTYSIERTMMNTAEISISNNHTSLKSLINMISVDRHSVALEWRSQLPETSNPISRVKNYIQAKKLQDNMADILKHLQSFLAQDDKVYGIYIHEIISKDSTLIAAKSITTSYPSTTEVYNLISSLKKYIMSQGAKENNFPMLHVKKIDEAKFETMVAIPVDKRLEGNGEIFFKQFVPWKVLTAEVRGGTYTVNEALNQMEIYIADYKREAMAIPFASLVTDRSRQPDTLKWITKIYTPVR